jgi:hypothetical protein
MSSWESLYESATWTRELRNFAKKADLAVLWFGSDQNAPSWHSDRKIVTLTLSQNTYSDKGAKAEISTQFAGAIRNGRIDGGSEKYNNPQNIYSPKNGHVVIGATPSSHLHAILMMLPIGSNLFFSQILDYGTSPIMEKVGLHCDITTLTVKTNKAGKSSSMSLDLAREICKHNTARFGF